MPRTGKTVASLLAVALLGAAPAMAQPANWNGSPSGWDRETFWHDAPSDLRQRIAWLQRRIDRGVQDGSLTRREARNFGRRLAIIRRDARRGSTCCARSPASECARQDR